MCLEEVESKISNSASEGGKANKYDLTMPQSQTADQPMAGSNKQQTISSSAG